MIAEVDMGEPVLVSRRLHFSSWTTASHPNDEIGRGDTFHQRR